VTSPGSGGSLRAPRTRRLPWPTTPLYCETTSRSRSARWTGSSCGPASRNCSRSGRSVLSPLATGVSYPFFGSVREDRTTPRQGHRALRGGERHPDGSLREGRERGEVGPAIASDGCSGRWRRLGGPDRGSSGRSIGMEDSWSATRVTSVSGGASVPGNWKARPHRPQAPAPGVLAPCPVSPAASRRPPPLSLRRAVTIPPRKVEKGLDSFQRRPFATQPRLSKQAVRDPCTVGTAFLSVTSLRKTSWCRPTPHARLRAVRECLPIL